MSEAWVPPPVPAKRPLRLRDWLRVARRGLPACLLLLVSFPILLILRLPERAIWGMDRPLTPWITQAVCVILCALIGLERRVSGKPMPQRGAFVANHSTWLDILALNASKRLYFVAKSEVHGWAGIGWLARGTGTVFIERNRLRAKEQQQLFEDRLSAGHKLLFFPEGTSTDGVRVLPFKTTLFQAFFSDALRDFLHIQPVSLRYSPPEGEGADYYGWWGDMDFASNLIRVLSTKRQGRIDVIYHEALKVADFADRKALALAVEEAVRAGFDQTSTTLPISDPAAASTPEAPTKR